MSDAGGRDRTETYLVLSLCRVPRVDECGTVSDLVVRERSTFFFVSFIVILFPAFQFRAPILTVFFLHCSSAWTTSDIATDPEAAKGGSVLALALTSDSSYTMLTAVP
jgi:hypothetical protein